MRYFVITEDKYYPLDMRKFKKGEEFVVQGSDAYDHNGEWLCSIYSKFAQHFGEVIEK